LVRMQFCRMQFSFMCLWGAGQGVQQSQNQTHSHGQTPAFA
jgi:hypothetical protein